jgi:hypothetical protein
MGLDPVTLDEKAPLSMKSMGSTKSIRSKKHSRKHPLPQWVDVTPDGFDPIDPIDFIDLIDEGSLF